MRQHSIHVIPNRAVPWTRCASGGILAVALLRAAPARADVLVPATFVVYGYLFELHLVPAIVLVETMAARRVLGLSWAKSVGLSAAANLASTAIGLLFVVPTTIWMSVRGSMEAGAFLLLLLCGPLCVLSIWIEGRIATWLMRSTRTPEQCARWSRGANLASYLMIAGVSVAILAASFVYRRRGFI